MDRRRKTGCQNPTHWNIFSNGTAGESPEITVDDPKDQISETTEIPAGSFAAVDVERAVSGLPNYKAGPNIVKNEGERLASRATAEVWKFYLPVITAFCAKVWNSSWQMKATSPALKTSEIAFLGKAKKGRSRPSDRMEDHQPPSAWRQSHDEMHLETNLAKSGSQDI